MARICEDCGFPMDRNHREHCIARQEARKRPGFKPGEKDRKQQAWDKLSTVNVQSGPRRG